MTKKPELNRRDFSKLSMAAFGGLMAGSMVGCGAKTEKVTPAAEGGEEGAKTNTQLRWERGRGGALEATVEAPSTVAPVTESVIARNYGMIKYNWSVHNIK